MKEHRGSHRPEMFFVRTAAPADKAARCGQAAWAQPPPNRPGSSPLRGRRPTPGLTRRGTPAVPESLSAQATAAACPGLAVEPKDRRAGRGQPPCRGLGRVRPLPETDENGDRSGNRSDHLLKYRLDFREPESLEKQGVDALIHQDGCLLGGGALFLGDGGPHRAQNKSVRSGGVPGQLDCAGIDLFDQARAA